MARNSIHVPFSFTWTEHCGNSLQWSPPWGFKAASVFAHTFSKDSVWVDCCSFPCPAAEELERKESTSPSKAHVPSFKHDPALLYEIHGFVSSLRACAKKKDLSRGARIHNDVLERGLLRQCSDALVTMYAKCGQLAKARELLDMHTSRDIFSWTDLIGGYARNGQGKDALHCFARMQQEGLSPNAATFTCILKACGNMRAIEKGKQIHDAICKEGLLENDIVLGNALVDMYAKCGDLMKAHSVLDKLPIRDVVSWSTLIAGYAQIGQCEQALHCYDSMQLEALCPDAVTLTCLLKACASTGECDKGEQIHDEIVKQGLLETDIVLGNALVDMYVKCGAFVKAERVLRELSARDVVTWSALIAGYAQVDQGEQALKCFEQMQHEGLSPDPVTFACILKSCGSARALNMGEKIHDEISRKGLLKDNIVLGNALVDMYVKCGALAKAQRALEELSVRDVVSWSTIIAGYAQEGEGEQALNCYEQMLGEGLLPNAVTFVCIMKACGSIGAVDKGREIHDEVSRQGLLRDNVVLGNAVVDMYAKCNALEKARCVLEELPVQNVVSWNALVSGYAQQGQAEQALDCFETMQSKGIVPDAVTFLVVLKACGSIGAVDKGEQIHDEITRLGLLSCNVVLGNALVSMYAKCGGLTKAQRVLELLPSQDAVSWNSLITAYVEQGRMEEVLKCYEEMQEIGINPNSVTFLSILKACANIGAFDKGGQIHDEIVRQGWLGSSTALNVALVDMYAKSGNLEKAWQVLKENHIHDIASWNALIGGYAQLGKAEQVLEGFKEMQCEHVSPDSVTLVYVLRSYEILGLLNEAHSCFMNMTAKYGINPNREHYTCVIDVLGRAGQLDKVAAIIQKTPSCDCSFARWSTLLSACQKWGNVNVGRWAFEQALNIDKGDPAAYVLMSKIYTDAGMEEDARKIEVMRSNKDAS